jgi:hypothetical protein
MRGIHKNLPRAIPPEKLQAMLGPSQAFCLWDASYSTTRDVTTGWPFLFAHPLMVPAKKPAQ